MAALPQTVTSQEPVNLGGGFEDPMDPCTMCQQGQMEIQQAYNELTQSCNACQTQQNLKTLTSSGCQGCAQAQQVIQNVQNQSGGCSSCGQPTTFRQLSQPMMQTQQPMLQPSPGTIPSQNFLMPGSSTMPMTMASQGLVQPMLSPLTGTGQQILNTVMPQPGMMAGQLPIAIERGATNQITPQPTILIGGMQTTQPMVVGMTTPVMTNQMMVSNIPSQSVQQPAPVSVIPPAPQPAPVMQPVLQPTPLPTPPPSAPVQQPVMQPVPTPPPPPPPVMQPAPTFNVPNLTPAQIAAAQQIAQAVTPNITQLPGGGLVIGGLGGATQGYGAGGGKAGPGAATTISMAPEGGFLYNFGTGFTIGGGVGGIGIGAPGAFDTHRPDLHAGGGWHMPLPLGTEGILNLY